jgi:hypothetical protein
VTYFHPTLTHFIALANDPNLLCAQLEAKLCSIHMPFCAVPVWHQIKYLCKDPVSKTTVMSDSIHVQPSTTDSCGCMVPGHFDTTLVNEGIGGDTGIEGKSSCLCLS